MLLFLLVMLPLVFVGLIVIKAGASVIVAAWAKALDKTVGTFIFLNIKFFLLIGLLSCF